MCVKGSTRLLTLYFHQHCYHNQGALLVSVHLLWQKCSWTTTSYSMPHLQNRWNSKVMVLKGECNSGEATVHFCLCSAPQQQALSRAHWDPHLRGLSGLWWRRKLGDGHSSQAWHFSECNPINSGLCSLARIYSCHFLTPPMIVLLINLLLPRLFHHLTAFIPCIQKEHKKTQERGHSCFFTWAFAKLCIIFWQKWNTMSVIHVTKNVCALFIVTIWNLMSK